MLPFAKLFRREDKFLSLLQASAREGLASAQALDQLLSGASSITSLEKVFKSRAKEEEIDSEIHALLCESFTTPLEREDIEMLSRLLSRIPKGVKKFAQLYLLSAPHLQNVNFAPQAKMLQEATEIVVRMVADLSGGPNIAATKSNNDLLQKIEGEADHFLEGALDALYRGIYPPLPAIMLKDLYEMLERIFDRCRNAGNIILQIVLKNS